MTNDERIEAAEGELRRAKANRSLLQAALVSMICAVVAAVAAVAIMGVITRRQTDQNNRQWCDLLTTLDSAYSEQPAASALGRRVGQSIHTLSIDFGCTGE